MMNAHVPFESWLERDVAMTPDLDPLGARVRFAFLLAVMDRVGCSAARVPDSAVREL
jgi:hypothetical protein